MISLRLITVKTRKPVATIADGGTYDFTTGDRTIEALPVPGAVRFNFDADGLKHSEGQGPFHLLGDDVAWIPAPGKRVVKVDALDVKGKTIDSATVTITAAGALPLGGIARFTKGTTDDVNLKAGDSLIFDSGERMVNTRTINPPENCLIGTANPSDSPAYAKVPSPAGHAIDFVYSKSAGTVVQGMVVECLGTDERAREAAAVRLAGKNQRVTNLTNIGVSRALVLGGAVGAICDNIIANTGSCAEYAMVSFGEKNGVPIWNDDCYFLRFDIAVTSNPSGVHAGRFEHTRRGQWGTLDKSVRLDAIKELPGPKGNGFAFRAKQGKFTALAINDGEDAKIYRGKIEGILALGPIEIWAGPHDDWRMKNPLVQECEVESLVCNRGTIGLKVKDCRIGRFEINHGIPGSFCDCDGTIDGTAFTDPAHKPPVNAKLTYTGSTWCGKTLGTHGEVVK